MKKNVTIKKIKENIINKKLVKESEKINFGLLFIIFLNILYLILLIISIFNIDILIKIFPSYRFGINLCFFFLFAIFLFFTNIFYDFKYNIFKKKTLNDIFIAASITAGIPIFSIGIFTIFLQNYISPYNLKTEIKNVTKCETKKTFIEGKGIKDLCKETKEICYYVNVFNTKLNLQETIPLNYCIDKKEFSIDKLPIVLEKKKEILELLNKGEIRTELDLLYGNNPE